MYTHVYFFKDILNIDPAKKIKFGNVFNTNTSSKLYTYKNCMNKVTFLFNNIFFVIYLFYLLLFLLLKIKIFLITKI